MLFGRYCFSRGHRNNRLNEWEIFEAEIFSWSGACCSCEKSLPRETRSLIFCFVKDLTTRLQTSRVTFMQLVKQLTSVFYS